MQIKIPTSLAKEYMFKVTIEALEKGAKYVPNYQ